MDTMPKVVETLRMGGVGLCLGKEKLTVIAMIGQEVGSVAGGSNLVVRGFGSEEPFKQNVGTIKWAKGGDRREGIDARPNVVGNQGHTFTSVLPMSWTMGEEGERLMKEKNWMQRLQQSAGDGGIAQGLFQKTRDHEGVEATRKQAALLWEFVSGTQTTEGTDAGEAREVAPEDLDKAVQLHHAWQMMRTKEKEATEVAVAALAAKGREELAEERKEATASEASKGVTVAEELRLVKMELAYEKRIATEKQDSLKKEVEQNLLLGQMATRVAVAEGQVKNMKEDGAWKISQGRSYGKSRDPSAATVSTTSVWTTFGSRGLSGEIGPLAEAMGTGGSMAELSARYVTVLGVAKQEARDANFNVAGIEVGDICLPPALLKTLGQRNQSLVPQKWMLKAFGPRTIEEIAMFDENLQKVSATLEQKVAQLHLTQLLEGETSGEFTVLELRIAVLHVALFFVAAGGVEENEVAAGMFGLADYLEKYSFRLAYFAPGGVLKTMVNELIDRLDILLELAMSWYRRQTPSTDPEEVWRGPRFTDSADYREGGFSLSRMLGPIEGYMRMERVEARERFARKEGWTTRVAGGVVSAPWSSLLKEGSKMSVVKIVGELKGRCRAWHVIGTCRPAGECHFAA
jgi:hypothetical protein